MSGSGKRRGTTTRPPQRPAASARRKSAAFRAAEHARERRRRTLRWATLIAGLAAVIAAITIGVIAASGTGSHAHAADRSTSDAATASLTGPAGPEGITLEQGPVLAPASAAADGQTADGIQCNSMEQAAYHIHTHLTIYINGALRPVPAGVGVVEPITQHSAHGDFDQASHCYYWLHTHAQDGIIHVEAPTHTTYTLGQFFAVWHQQLSPHQVGPSGGAVTAFINGTRYTGDPTAIPLTSHEDIQLDVGTPVIAAKKIDWSHAQL